MAFYTHGVAFDDLITLLRIYKKQDKKSDEILVFFSQESSQQFIKNEYERIPPITVKEAIQLPNAEQRMIALRSFPIDEITRELDAELLDKQTIHKKQVRWNADLKPYPYQYEDTYELYKIGASTLGITQFWREPAIYFVKCKCASSERIYFMYVSPEVGEKKDAIEAIAWTMRYNNYPLTKQQYLNLMYTET